MIKSIFFTRFHPEKGPQVLHQVPSGSIVPSVSSASRIALPPLFDFPSISDYLIPREEFCDRLITICVNHYRILGYPVSIKSNGNRRYDRNRFIFNLALVLDEDVADISGYASVVKKLARMFKNLEEQSGFLSAEEGADILDGGSSPLGAGEGMDLIREDTEAHELESISALDIDSDNEANIEASVSSVAAPSMGSKVYALCEMILEDLNNYCECMIPIDDSNTINLKLFPTRPHPPPIHAWHVPLSTVHLSTLSLSSDLTLLRIVPFINGVRSVRQIAHRADTDLNLTRKAMRHLLYYGCVILLDVFQFGAAYAPTAEIGCFVEDAEMQEECRRYVGYPSASWDPGAHSSDDDEEDDGDDGDDDSNRPPPESSSQPPVECETLVRLYTSLRQGQPLHRWVLDQLPLLAGIDVRRLITFGVIKGFLYRVHKYAVAAHSYSGAASRAESLRGEGEGGGGGGGDERVGAWDGREGEGGSGREEGNGEGQGEGVVEVGGLPMARYLDGMHCFDEICTELRMSERQVMEKIRRAYGEVHVLQR